MKKILIYVWIGSLALFTSCNDWLNIDPQTEIDSESLYQNVQGFNVALNGVYVGLASSGMHGGQLTYGGIEALAHTYESTRAMFQDLRNYDYNTDYAKAWYGNIWTKSYNLIANCNEILKQIEKKDKNFFTEEQHAIIKGQALAARAMLHFNIARIFAPAPVKGDAELLPYYEQITHIASPKISTREFLNKVIKDFQDAQGLMAAYDTTDVMKAKIKNARFAYSQGGMEKSAGFRFNYYSVSALLARAALYAGNNPLALENANRVVNAKYNSAKIFLFTTLSNINSGKHDRLFSEDILFGLYQKEEEFDKIVTSIGDEILNNYEGVFSLTQPDKRMNLCYDAGMNLKKSYKYTGKHFTKSLNYVIPMIRLSEMYYIIAEVNANNEEYGVAIKYLNDLRKARGCNTNLPTVNSLDEFIAYLIQDVRRETLIEGQLFFYYKRLDHPVVDEKYGNQTLDTEFVLPIPDNEIVG